MLGKGLRRFAGYAVLLGCAACSTEKNAAPPSGPPPNAKIVDAAKAANVSGRVTIEGAVPANPPVQMSGDPYCSEQNPKGAMFENFVVDDGGLENVFVYVSDKLDYYFEV